MFRFARPFAFVICASFVLFATGCKSNNEGKIVGKWKILSAPGTEQMLKLAQADGGYLYFEFKSDGTMLMGFGATDPKVQAKIEEDDEKDSLSWKYKLLAGAGVEFYDLPAELKEQGGGGLFGRNEDRARTKVKIDGDNMSMTDDDGSVCKLVRVK
jgi:hypothetical protein